VFSYNIAFNHTVTNVNETDWMNCAGDGDGFWFLHPSGPVFGAPDVSYQFGNRNAMYVAAQASWWATFANNLFSWKNFTNEFKQGGCVALFKGTAFDEPLHEAGDAIKEAPEVLQNIGEGVVGGGLIFTSLGAWSESATVLTSSGLKLQSVGEMASAAGPEFGAGAVDLSMALALRKEIKAMRNGHCH